MNRSVIMNEDSEENLTVGGNIPINGADFILKDNGGYSITLEYLWLDSIEIDICKNSFSHILYLNAILEFEIVSKTLGDI